MPVHRSFSPFGSSSDSDSTASGPSSRSPWETSSEAGSAPSGSAPSGSNAPGPRAAAASDAQARTGASSEAPSSEAPPSRDSASPRYRAGIGGDGSRPDPDDVACREALRDALDRERAINDGLMRSVDGLFAIVDASGTVRRWNHAFADAAGVSSEAVAETPLVDLFPETGRRLQVILKRALTNGRATLQAELVGHTEAAESGLRPSRPVPYAISSTRVEGTDEPLVAFTGTRLDEHGLVRQALREHEQQYHLIADHVADVISRHAPDTTCLYASPSTESLLGVAPEDIVGRRTIELVHPDDRELVEAGLEETLDGEIVKERIRIRHADGYYIWVEVTSRLRLDPSTGRPLDLIASTRDVSDRVAAEQALQESEARFRQLAENVEGVFWLCTRDEILYVSPAYESIWERSREELYKDPTAFLDAVHPDDRSDAARVLRSMWTPDADESYDNEFRITTPGGTERWVRAVSSRVPIDDGPDRFAGYAVDVTEQKRQEEATRQSEERWRRLVETHMEPIMISVEGEIKYVNPSGAELFGGESPDDLIGRELFDFVEPSFRDEIRKRAARVDAGEATEPFEHRMRRLDGEVRIVVSYSVAIQYDGQRAAQTVLRDVTDWRRAQSKLEYRVLMENLIVDLSTRLIDTGSEITDQSIEEALGRIGPFVGADRSYVFLASDDGERFFYTHEWCAPGIAPQKDAIAEVEADEMLWFYDQLSTLRPVHIPSVEDLPPEADNVQAILEAQSIESLVCVPMTEGAHLIGFVGFDAVQQPRTWEEETIMLLRVLGDTFANALARMETEQALREREAQYRTVVENVRDVVFQTDTEGRWTFLNPAWESVTGYTVDESLGEPCDAFLESDRFDDAADHVTLLCGNKTRCRYEVQLHGREGTRWMALFAQATFDDEGERTGVAGTLHDITERKRMEQQTREALRRERELNRLKSSFVSMVSHEFRTPLSTIRSSSEMIDRFIDTWPKEKRDKYLRRIRRQVDRMSRLLGDVITTSKLDAHDEGPDLFDVQLRPFMREIGEEMRAHFQTDCNLEVNMHDLPDTVLVDRDLLHHIVGNLVSNAIKYSPDDEPVEVDLTVDDEHLHLHIRDHGIGIPKSDAPHLFQAFYRGDNVGNAEGVGLGMTIVRRAVDVYRGSIDWETTPGGGTTFHVELPASEAAVETQDTVKPLEADDGILLEGTVS